MIRKKTESGWWEGELQVSIMSGNIRDSFKRLKDNNQWDFLQARGKKRQIGWFPASYVKVLISTSNRSTPVSHRYQDSPTGDPFAGIY